MVPKDTTPGLLLKSWHGKNIRAKEAIESWEGKTNLYSFNYISKIWKLGELVKFVYIITSPESSKTSTIGFWK